MKIKDVLKIYNSPFKRPKLKWYFGRVAIGTPYFLPRKWVKPTHEMAVEAAMKEIANAEDWNKRNPNSNFKHKVRELDLVYAEKLNHLFAVPKKIGFDFVNLGWKTKWNNLDYRFESQPIISFVFFKWQIAVIISAPVSKIDMSHYWEGWLYYFFNTKGTKRERIEQCKKDFPLGYSSINQVVNSYDVILKDKYK
jgi:hypothetical protein